MRKLTLSISVILFLTSCVTTQGPSGPGVIGNNRNNDYSLKDLREANKVIKYSDILPSNAEVIGKFTVRRCHRYANDPVPSDQTLINDLKLAAYAEGADGIAGFELKKSTGLLYNCWQVRDATSTFYKIKK